MILKNLYGLLTVVLPVVVAHSATDEPRNTTVRTIPASLKAHAQALEAIRDGVELLCSNQAYARRDGAPVLTLNARNHMRRVARSVAKTGLDPNRNFETREFMTSLELDLATHLALGADCERVATYVLQQRLIPHPPPQDEPDE